jgi:protein TonB
MSASTVTMARASGSPLEPDVAAAPGRPRNAHRVGGRPTRMAALVATVVVHLAVGAMVTIGWPQFESARGTPHLASVVILPRAMDEPRRRPTSGMQAQAPRPEPLPAPASPPPTILLAPPTPAATEAVAQLRAPAEGGREDELVAVTQAYRREVMARLEARRRPMREDAAGDGLRAGTVAFRIDRGGQLLEASVTQSTGRAALDRAALSIVRRAAPFPAIPDALPDELAITLPVEFLAGRGRTGIAAR